MANGGTKLRNIIKLERSPLGLPEMYNMPLTKGYFNGCLLTITNGPATLEEGIDRVGSIIDCRQTTLGMTCKE